jgi:hypothetical protein
VRYTIKGGVVYDAAELLTDVRAIVGEARGSQDGRTGPERLPFIPAE